MRGLQLSTHVSGAAVCVYVCVYARTCAYVCVFMCVCVYVGRYARTSDEAVCVCVSV